MKRPILITSIMYMVGILIGLYLKISVVQLCIIIGLISFFVYILKINKIIYFFMIIILIGNSYIVFLEKNYEKKYLKIPKEVCIEGTIISNKTNKDYKYTYILKVNKINQSTEFNGIELIINIKKSNIKNNITYGNKIEIIGTYEQPNEARNYKGFDYKQYLKTKNIYGLIEVNNYSIIKEKNINKVLEFINNIKLKIKNNLLDILEKEEAGLCIGILIGDRENISEQTEENFRKSNLTHLLAVSGSHITYIITTLTTILGNTNRKFSKIFTIFFLIFFMALTDFTPSVMRASIMGILVLIASILYKKSDTINNLSIALFIILIYNPYYIIDTGFLLSFAGTIGIIIFSERLTNYIKEHIKIISISKKELNKENVNKFIFNKLILYLINSFSVTISANIFIIPIIAYLFSTISLSFWISNILIAPIMEITTIYSFIIYFISLICPIFSEFLGIFLNYLLKIFLIIAEISSKIPYSQIYIKTPKIITCLNYYVIIFYLLYIKNSRFIIYNKIKFYFTLKQKENFFIHIVEPFFLIYRKFIILKKYKLKILVIFVILIIANVSIFNLFTKKLQIYFIDVGQGDCTLIKTLGGKNILIDGGGSEFGSFDVGKQILLPYLLDRGITKIDYLMISHFDSDHIGGLFYILENLKVENIIISKQGKISENFEKFIKIIKNKKTNLKIVKKGDLIKIDDLSYFEILFPEDNLINENTLNNNSIVAKFISNNITMLFTGDIEKIAEERIGEIYKENFKLESTILKVAHHGSKTSSLYEFLDLVNPKIAIIGVGENNNFGHPNKEVLQRLVKYTNKIYRTDLCGEIIIECEKNKIKIKTKLNNNRK